MSTAPNDAQARRLRGLDPTKLLSVLGREVPPEAPKLPGWKIVGVAGEGGSGIVWEARRTSDGRRAAIKVAPPEDLEMVARVEIEAQALRELNHPNIVRLIDFGLISDGPLGGGVFLAMEFVEGGRLSDIIPAGGMSSAVANDHFEAIATAVSHAHANGILHRDLKPSNVLIDANGMIKVADFGLARPVHGRVQALSLTRAGVVAGSFEYLPPEAYHGGYEPDVAGDIYALGVMLHEMLTGTPPRGRWKPASEKLGVDVRSDGLIERALDPDPAKRWPDVNTMLSELRAIRMSPPRYSGTPRVTSAVRLADALWTILGLLALLTACGTAMRLTGSRVPPWIDLIGGHGTLVGGFQATATLLMILAPVSIWQLVRLFRFRSVPMREALPSPFGLKLGHGRLCLGLVGLAQIFCLLIPAGLVLSFVGNLQPLWLEADDAPWVHGLAVTSWHDTRIVSPWAWPEPGKPYWLYESFGPPGSGLSRTVDRISFFPFILPLIMSVAAGCAGLAILGTMITAARRWHQRGRNAALLLILLGLFICLSTILKVVGKYKEIGIEVRRITTDFWHNRALELIHHHAQWRIARATGNTQAMPSHDPASLYAEMVNFGNDGLLPRDQLSRLFRAEMDSPMPRCALSHGWVSPTFDPTSGRFSVICGVLEWFDGAEYSGETCRAARVIVELEGEFHQGHPRITSEKIVREPCYSAQARRATPDEIAQWADAFLPAIHADPAAAASMLNPLQLRFHDSPPRPEHPKIIVGELRRQPEVKRAGPVTLTGSAPGGRSIARIPMRSEDQHFTGEFQLVRTPESWQAVHVQFVPNPFGSP